MHKNRFSLSLLLLALPLFSLGACEPLLGPSQPRLSGSGMNMFAPVKTRLHPLSRVTTTGNAPLIEARVEFTDQFGDTGKGVGEVHFAAYAFQSLALANKGKLLGQWQIGLSTPADNREHWDPITRTYFFKLPLPPDSLKNRGKIILTVHVTLPNGQALSDDITLPVK